MDLRSQLTQHKSYIDSMRRMYDKPVAQTSTTLILTFATIVFFGFAAIRPSLGVITKLQSELSHKRELSDKLEQKVKVLINLQSNYSSNEETLSVFEQAIPNEQLLEELIVAIEYLNYKNEVELTNLRVNNLVTYGLSTSENSDEPEGPSNVPEPYPSYHIDFNSGGSYQNLVNLLDELGRLYRYVVIERVTFNQTDEEDVAYEQIMGVRIKVYWAEADSLATNRNSP